jgi:hypothetical protein
MNALQARIQQMTSAEIADAIVMLGRNGNLIVRVALCNEYEARLGGEALDALFERELAA